MKPTSLRFLGLLLAAALTQLGCGDDSSGSGTGGAGGSGATMGSGGSGGAAAYQTKLYAIRNANMQWHFGELNPATGALVAPTLITGFGYVSYGSTTINSVTGQYHVESQLGYLSIDVSQGTVVNTAPNLGISVFVESNPLTGVVSVIYGNPVDLYFGTLNTATAAITPLAPLTGVTSIETTTTVFDPTQNQFSVNTNLGYITIDASTGAIVHTAPNPHEFGVVECDPFDGTLYGMAQVNTQWFFGTIDKMLGTFTAVAAVPSAQGVDPTTSALDPSKREYYVLTIGGFLTIDLDNGAVLNTVTMPEPIGFVEAYLTPP